MFARWLAPEEMAGGNWQSEGGLLLGRRDGRAIGWNDDRHVMTIAGSRAGKGLSLIVPNLLRYAGSALVIDPKGELAQLTADRRGDGKNIKAEGLKQDVWVLDPFGVSKRSETHSFNPLDELDLKNADVIDDAATLASALIEVPQSGEKHWAESAQAVLKALILLVLELGKDDDRDLISVRELLSLTHPRIESRKVKKRANNEKINDEEALISLLVDGLYEDSTNPCASVCAAVGKQLRSMGDKERGGVMSSALTQTQWLDSKKMRAVLRGENKFKLADLKRKEKKTTIYLCLPANRLPTHSRWLRLMILLSLTVMERTEIDGRLDVKPPVLYVLDEFAVLGHIDSLEKAAGLMAGYGVKLWVILQSLGQLKQHYNQAWETFFANSGVVTAFGVGDHESLEVLSKMLGQTRLTESVGSRASSEDLQRAASGTREERHDVYLLGPHELRMALARRKGRILICAAEEAPAIAQRVKYIDREFDGMYPEVP
ncbi:type IV secretory system conjugative DNA transfer family protein [Hyphomicrobium sp.]|jgi:type IV secretion system protein VirD4|uniref:type IV secretory system conjugative DNA transfer family protein n=1 Tax=Hyphomicrobium sp. TaxID=82 RepID=UPI003565DF74